MAVNFKIIAFKSAGEWEKWLAKHHAVSPGLWLKLFKKSSGKETVNYGQALEGALCYGWIDGQKAPFDDKAWLQKFTPRRPKSVWSKNNTAHAKRLIQEGRMKPAGLQEIEAAKKDGRWAKAYHPQSQATLPEDFLREVNKNEKAQAFLKTLNRVNVYAIIYRLHSAKKPETRQKRLKQFIEMLSNGKKLHP